MQLDVTPPLGDDERRALLAALELAEQGYRREPRGDAWRLAGLRESVEADADVGYAFSPRSTRGATRA